RQRNHNDIARCHVSVVWGLRPTWSRAVKCRYLADRASNIGGSVKGTFKCSIGRGGGCPGAIVTINRFIICYIAAIDKCCQFPRRKKTDCACDSCPRGAFFGPGPESFCAGKFKHRQNLSTQRE